MNWLPLSVFAGLVCVVSPVFAQNKRVAGYPPELCGFDCSAAQAAAKAHCVPTFPRPAEVDSPAPIWGEGIPNASPLWERDSNLRSPRYAKPFTTMGYAKPTVVGELPPPAGKVFDAGARVKHYLLTPYSTMYWPAKQQAQFEVAGAYDPSDSDTVTETGSVMSNRRPVDPAANMYPVDDPRFVAMQEILTAHVTDVNSRTNVASVGDKIEVDDDSADVEFFPSPAAWQPCLDESASFGGKSLLARLDNNDEAKAVFSAAIAETGLYEVQMWWVPGLPGYRGANVPVILHSSIGDITKTIDQTNPALRKQWNSLGTIPLLKGETKPIVTVSTKGMPLSDTETISVDAIRIVKVQD